MMALLAFVIGPIGRYLILAVAIGAAALYFVAHERSIGAADLTNKIENANKESANAANAAQARVQACFDSGGTFDDASGKCAK